MWIQIIICLWRFALTTNLVPSKQCAGATYCCFLKNWNLKSWNRVSKSIQGVLWHVSDCNTTLVPVLAIASFVVTFLKHILQIWKQSQTLEDLNLVQTLDTDSTYSREFGRIRKSLCEPSPVAWVYIKFPILQNSIFTSFIEWDRDKTFWVWLKNWRKPEEISEGKTFQYYHKDSTREFLILSFFLF